MKPGRPRLQENTQRLCALRSCRHLGPLARGAAGRGRFDKVLLYDSAADSGLAVRKRLRISRGVMTTSPDTGRRVAVLTLESLACRMLELAERAFDVSDRFTGETDADMAAQLSLLSGIADSCVWGSPSDYDDEAGLSRLQHAGTMASNAWRFLRSDCPATQRGLKPASAEDLEFIRERMLTRRRSDSAWCIIESREGDMNEYGALRQVRLPGIGSGLMLDSVLHCCTDLAQARRVLRAFGIEADYSEREGSRVLVSRGHTIIRSK